MNNELIEKYKKELMQVYGQSAKAKAANSADISGAVSNSASDMNESIKSADQNSPKSNDVSAQNATENSTALAPQSNIKAQGQQQSLTRQSPESGQDIGRLVVAVTTLRYLYPVTNAKVTVFTGPYETMSVVATDITDSSGKTKPFELYAPPIAESLRPDETVQPYAEYNLLVQADGYVDNIHLKIPVFKGITSLQRSNLISVESAGPHAGPFVFESSRSYDL